MRGFFIILFIFCILEKNPYFYLSICNYFYMQPIVNFIGSIICFVPAVAILYFILKKYEGLYDEQKIFISLLFGFFLGLISAIFEMVGFFSLKPYVRIEGGLRIVIYDIFTIISIFGIALFQNALKSLALTMQRFREGSVFYGASVGLGFGALYSFVAIANVNLDYNTLATTVFLILGIIFLQCCFGIIIGYGIHKKRFLSYFVLAVILQIILNIIFFYAYSLTRREELIIPAIITFLFGINLYLYIDRNIIPDTLPDNLKKERRRKMRKGEI